jgi:SAM-dependent methyltransferase
MDDRWMPRDGDAFGAILLQCWEAGAEPWSAIEVIERSDGLITANDAARYFAPPERWDAMERAPIDTATGRVLDIGAGAGRHVLYLQERGHEVVALDLSPGACEVCRRRGVRHVSQGTIFDLPDGERFDTFLLMGNNLGLLESREHAPRFLGRLAELAEPGASIIATGTDPRAPGGDMPSYHLAYQRANEADGRMTGQISIRVRHLDRAMAPFDYLLVGPDVLRELVVDTPWEIEDLHGSGRPYVVVLRLNGHRA